MSLNIGMTCFMFPMVQHEILQKLHIIPARPLTPPIYAFNWDNIPMVLVLPFHAANVTSKRCLALFRSLIEPNFAVSKESKDKGLYARRVQIVAIRIGHLFARLATLPLDIIILRMVAAMRPQYPQYPHGHLPPYVDHILPPVQFWKANWVLYGKITFVQACIEWTLLEGYFLFLKGVDWMREK
jgi:hypothetical protein